VCVSGVVVPKKVFAQYFPPDRDPGVSIPGGFSPAAAAIREHLDWVNSPGKLLGFVGSTTVRIEQRGNDVNPVKGYVSGITGGRFRFENGMLIGEGQQYFSDRVYDPDRFVYPGPGGIPFDYTRREILGLHLDPATGKAKVILRNWGNASFEIPLQYQNGVFYGFEPGKGLYTFVITRLDVPR
jgi:hypothetical protein